MAFKLYTVWCLTMMRWKIQRKKLQKFYNNYLIFGIFIVRMSSKYCEVACYVCEDWLRLQIYKLTSSYKLTAIMQHRRNCTLTPALLYAETRSFLKFDIVYADPATLDALIWQSEKPQRCAASFTILDVEPGEPSETIRAWLHSCGDCITRTRRQIASIVSWKK